MPGHDTEPSNSEHVGSRNARGEGDTEEEGRNMQNELRNLKKKNEEMVRKMDTSSSVVELLTSTACLAMKRYLGVPVVYGRLKLIHFPDIIHRIRMKFEGWKINFLSTGARLILLKHVLSSIPVHLLSVLHVPTMVFHQFNKIFSTFFWGSINGSPKKKWIKRDRLCKLVDEGGVGLRNLVDVQRSLHLKFAWNLLCSDSLWKIFFCAKYMHGQHLLEINPSRGTWFWKSISKEIPIVLSHSKWKIRDGNVSFWRDNWLSTGSLIDQYPIVGDPKLKVKHCMIDNSWDLDLLENLVGPEKTEQIVNDIREGAFKDINHVLYRGDIASIIWKFSSNCFGIPFVPNRSWRATVEAWFWRASKSSQLGSLIVHIPVIITWNLWNWRCKAQMEGRKEKVHVLWRLIKYWIYWVGLKINKASRLVENDVKILRCLNLSINPSKKEKLMVVRWEKPKRDWLKMNVDGSSINNLGILGAGGVVRNEFGRVVFAESIGNGSNNIAEVMALWINPTL
ncbi:uncharacterized protein LOC122304835 [Carya illinoinensis]|uniref:uncharacterized protein LOC122304835 n=1 Tax=Carya illinoinensis TaxID=32201 RepID=UPI001C728AFC|nr:uncharacterized protein LOC122304835 [Carya illinoinensis]